jgi:aromatic ring-opening dioxygenase LigB subunit
MLAAAYYIWKGKSVTDALAFVKKGRRVMHLTPAQISGLRTFAKRITRQRAEEHRHICEICQKTCR